MAPSRTPNRLQALPVNYISRKFVLLRNYSAVVLDMTIRLESPEGKKRISRSGSEYASKLRAKRTSPSICSDREIRFRPWEMVWRCELLIRL